MNESLLTPPSADTLDADHIARLIDRFYDKVRTDDLIGPVFNAVVSDWDEHKERLTRFWCSVALRSGTYQGNPMSKHRPLVDKPHGVDGEHFERWLSLWRQTVPEIMSEDATAILVTYAERIGHGLQTGMGIGACKPGGAAGISIGGADMPRE